MKRGSQFPFNKRLAAGAVLALQAARDVLDDEDRRCRGVWARDEHGQQVPHTSPKSARFSLVGAIKAACLDLKLSWNVHQVAMLTMVLCLPEGQEYLDELNDDPNVSHAEVLAVLDKDIHALLSFLSEPSPAPPPIVLPDPKERVFMSPIVSRTAHNAGCLLQATRVALLASETDGERLADVLEAANGQAGERKDSPGVRALALRCIARHLKWVSPSLIVPDSGQTDAPDRPDARRGAHRSAARGGGGHRGVGSGHAEERPVRAGEVA